MPRDLLATLRNLFDCQKHGLSFHVPAESVKIFYNYIKEMEETLLLSGAVVDIHYPESKIVAKGNKKIFRSVQNV